jgi:hypothetical protein
MSVSSHLRSNRSSVRAWFAENLPNTAKLATAANRALTRPVPTPPRRETLTGSPLQVIALRHARNPERAPLAGTGNRSLVGTAVDLLVNQTLDPSYDGRSLRGSPTLEGASLVSGCEQALPPLLADGDVLAAVPHVLTLAAFHQAARSGEVKLALKHALETHQPATAEACRGVLWQPDDERDLISLGPAALEDMAFVQTADRVTVNPVFSLSRRLGGADGYLTADGTLWDYKSTAMSHVVGRQEIWQLAAYLLADDQDEYGLHSVGVIALRWRTRITWPATNLLATLSGKRVDEISIADWRHDFAAILPAERPRRRPRPVIDRGRPPKQ